MTKIADLFKCKISFKGKNRITIVAQANSKHHLIKAYFDKFPLMSNKYLDYLCYIEGLNYLGRHLTSQEILEIQTIKNSMNNKRDYFRLRRDHLKNFYT